MLLTRLADSDGAPVSVATLCEWSGWQRAYLMRVFRVGVGLSPGQYQQVLAAERLVPLLKQGARVLALTFAAERSSPSRLHDLCVATTSVPPGTWARQGAGLMLSATLASTCWGWLLVATCARGVCAVRLGQDAAALRTWLAARFANAEISWTASPATHEALQTLLAWLPLHPGLAAGETSCAPQSVRPLKVAIGDLPGTALQVQVWQALLALSPDETSVVSYGQLAQAVGHPRAVRAVASAVAANPVQLLIPCHRVIRASGVIGDYAAPTGLKALLISRGLPPFVDSGGAFRRASDEPSASSEETDLRAHRSTPHAR